MSHDSLRQALAAWREAEQRLAAAAPGSFERAEAQEVAETARRRYRDMATGDPSTRDDDDDDAER